jgi:hypothetical protein
VDFETGRRVRTERVGPEKEIIAFGVQEWLRRAAVGARQRPRGVYVGVTRVRELMRIWEEERS